jgi:hypothetical protein
MFGRQEREKVKMRKGTVRQNQLNGVSSKPRKNGRERPSGRLSQLSDRQRQPEIGTDDFKDARNAAKTFAN